MAEGGHSPSGHCFALNALENRVYDGVREAIAALVDAGLRLAVATSKPETFAVQILEHFDPRTGEGTGFVFEHFDATGFTWALKTALTTYRDRKAWKQLRLNGMAKDFSWERQGAEYEDLYAQLIS